ncbi:MAG: hypothetical protein HRT45_11340 [Bdellovibrionales bacterium]|nr:hypothetical protein [Bdellovibrionales bacterium]
MPKNLKIALFTSLLMSGLPLQAEEELQLLMPKPGTFPTAPIAQPPTAPIAGSLDNLASTQSQSLSEQVITLDAGYEMNDEFNKAFSQSFQTGDEAIKVKVQMTDLQTDLDIALKINGSVAAASDLGDSSDEMFEICLSENTNFDIVAYAYPEEAQGPTQTYSLSIVTSEASDCELETTEEVFSPDQIQTVSSNGITAPVVDLGKLSASSQISFKGAIGRSVSEGEFIETPELQKTLFRVRADKTVISTRADYVIAVVELTGLQQDLELKVVDELSRKPENAQCNPSDCTSLAGGRESEAISIRIPRGESVFISVESASGDANSQYQLSIATKEPRTDQELPQIKN